MICGEVNHTEAFNSCVKLLLSLRIPIKTNQMHFQLYKTAPSLWTYPWGFLVGPPVSRESVTSVFPTVHLALSESHTLSSTHFLAHQNKQRKLSHITDNAEEWPRLIETSGHQPSQTFAGNILSLWWRNVLQQTLTHLPHRHCAVFLAVHT